MNILKATAVVVCVIPLVGCPTMRPAQPPGPIQVQGSYNHPGSKMVFPERVGQFQRVQITQYAPGERDVGIGYNLINPDAPVAATVYVYPAPRVISIGSPRNVVEGARAQLFQNHLSALKNEITGAHPDAKLISDGDFTLSQAGQTHQGRKVAFEFAYAFGLQSQDSISELYLFQSGTWLIKYRITFPKATSVQAHGAVTDFLNGLEWPKE